ncbi:hypothetical protein B0H10DRAFT_1824402, partial [Mycena sp. CBHHK59/15]
LAPVPANTDVVAWSGNTCNGAEGGDVACDGTFWDFTNRHLIERGACVSVFEDKSCEERVGTYQNQGGGSCVNVNTGTTVQSFKCFAGNTC